MFAARGMLITIAVVAAPTFADAQATKIADCVTMTQARQRAGCLLTTEDPGAISLLLEIAQKAYRDDPDLGGAASEDLFYAAENAGAIAAKAEHAALLQYAGASDAASQIFACRALHQVLFLLRSAHARGGEADEKRLSEIRAPVAAACAAVLSAREDRAVQEAAACVGEARDNVHTAALIAVMVSTNSLAVQQAAFAALKNLEGMSGKKGELKKLASVLSKPLAAKTTAEEISLRGNLCSFLTIYVDKTDAWVKKPASYSARQLGDKNPGEKAKCDRLAGKR